MSKKIELLAPGGDVTAIKAAIIAGANAIYCGLNLFNARSKAVNLTLDQLKGVLRLAHQYECEVFLTLNILIIEYEVKSVIKLLNQLVNTSLDGVIVQDLGLLYILKKHFPTMAVHASTQLTTHNEGQILFLETLGVERVNLSRELNLTEIKPLSKIAHDNNVLIEVFVHGALCVAFSGQCYASVVLGNGSANRGHCSQLCRSEYETTETGSQFPLNIKDNSAYLDLPDLIEAGVDSLKIEGRIKGAEYVHTVVESWRKQINEFEKSGGRLEDDAMLHKVFNRGFSNDFLSGELKGNMFTDSPRDQSLQYAHASSGDHSVEFIDQQFLNDKQEIKETVADKTSRLSTDKPTFSILCEGQVNEFFTLNISLVDAQQSQVYKVQSTSLLRLAEKSAITQEVLEKRFKSFHNSDVDFIELDLSALGESLSVPFKELTEMKQAVLFILNGEKELINEVSLPKLEHEPKRINKTTRSALICDEDDIKYFDLEASDTALYFKLPESYKSTDLAHIKKHPLYKLFMENPRLIPWIPGILIGDDYAFVAELLNLLKPNKIVTNNTGMAYHAEQLGINWIAGALMNTTNSYTLLALSDFKYCQGAFISNEISQNQMRNLKRPENFKLSYSIYHPMMMMTSRQCFFQATVGCHKTAMDDYCMTKCEKRTSITNLKGHSFAVDKIKGGYPTIYHSDYFLNLAIIDELDHLFDDFFIDLTDTGHGSKATVDKAVLIKLFKQVIAHDDVAKEALLTLLPATNCIQYQKGL